MVRKKVEGQWQRKKARIWMYHFPRQGRRGRRSSLERGKVVVRKMVGRMGASIKEIG